MQKILTDQIVVFYLWKTDQIFMKIFIRDVTSDKKIPVKFRKSSGSGSGPEPPWRRSALSKCGVFLFLFLALQDWLWTLQ